MTDAHIRRRVSMCLIALIVGSALPTMAETQKVDDVVKQQQMEIEKLKSSVAMLLTAAQARKPEEVDLAVRQQEMELGKLKSSLEQANRDTAALQRRIEEMEKKPASPEAWITLRTVGVTFILVWGFVSLLRQGSSAAP